MPSVNWMNISGFYRSPELLLMFPVSRWRCIRLAHITPPPPHSTVPILVLAFRCFAFALSRLHSCFVGHPESLALLRFTGRGTQTRQPGTPKTRISTPSRRPRTLVGIVLISRFATAPPPLCYPSSSDDVTACIAMCMEPVIRSRWCRFVVAVSPSPPTTATALHPYVGILYRLLAVCAAVETSNHAG